MVVKDRHVRGRVTANDVASALRHLHDLATLSDSPLCELPEVQEMARHSRAIFAEARELRDQLTELVSDVIRRLPEDDMISRQVRATLQGILDGRTIAAVAREHGKSRECWSRTRWKQAAELVSQEMDPRTD